MSIGTYNLESIPIIDDTKYEHIIGCTSYIGLMYEFKIFASPMRDTPGHQACKPKFCSTCPQDVCLLESDWNTYLEGR